MRASFIQTFTFHFCPLPPLLVHCPSKCRPLLKIQWNTISCSYPAHLNLIWRRLACCGLSLRIRNNWAGKRPGRVAQRCLISTFEKFSYFVQYAQVDLSSLIPALPKTISFPPAYSPHFRLETMPIGFLWTFWAQLVLLSLIIVFKTKTFVERNTNTEQITTAYNLHLSPTLVKNLV